MLKSYSTVTILAKSSETSASIEDYSYQQAFRQWTFILFLFLGDNMTVLNTADWLLSCNTPSSATSMRDAGTLHVFGCVDLPLWIAVCCHVYVCISFLCSVLKKEKWTCLLVVYWQQLVMIFYQFVFLDFF